MISDNILLMTDSYKVSHHKQYPPHTQTVYSYLEARKGGRYTETVFFGLQYILLKYLTGRVVTQEKINEAREFFKAHFGNLDLFNEAGWQHILDQHGGYLPIRVKAVPEGTVVPEGNVLMTVENTDPNVPWLTNYLETLLCQVWYPMTVATQSRGMKQTLLASLEATGDPSLVGFKLHDFGYRGVSSQETAALGAAAHLVNFFGTDTLAGVVLARDFYSEPMAGFSIPAAEHSTITSWGREREADAYLNMLTQYPTGLVAVVSDSYDVMRACEYIWGEKLREQVLARDGVLIIRPDSGEPTVVVCEVLRILGEKFGYTTNDKGYKVLNPKVRVIQGDGIDFSSMTRVLLAMQMDGWSADNIAFGSGGGLLQKLNRDTQRVAFKASAIEIGGVWHPVMKNPVTDPSKVSKAGRLRLVKDGGQFVTVSEGTVHGNMCRNLPDELVLVFENGYVRNLTTFSEVRERASL